MAGCGLRCRQALLPPVTVILHQKRNVYPLHQMRRHFGRASKSKVTPYNSRKPRQFWPASCFRRLTCPLGRCQSE
ncbi:hypothetical protein OH690_05345 [Escherichia coli]|nr:hypothetical protein [Escherichia coli]